jgi:DNA replication protein DnaC
LPGRTLDAFEFDAVPMVSKAHAMAIRAGDSWIDKGANLILIGGPGGGKTHLTSVIGLALVENGCRVLFARTSDLVQKLQFARRELRRRSTGLTASIWLVVICHQPSMTLPMSAKIRRKPRFCSN